jgi:probable rRNA maturation factor
MDGSGPTDVLAFPVDDPAEVPVDVPVLLGDVVVCPSVAARQAPEHAGDYHAELALLVVHGVLHLLGDNHADPDQAAAMQTKERGHLARHGVERP